MRVMISLPMNGRKDSEVISRMREIKEKFDKLHIEVVNSFVNDLCPEGTNHPNVYYLGRSILNFLSNVDAVYFDDGWELARGCKIERKICEEYGILILDKTFFKDDISKRNDDFTITPFEIPDLINAPKRSNNPFDPFNKEGITITCQTGKHFE